MTSKLKHVQSLRRQILIFLDSPSQTLEVSFRGKYTDGSNWEYRPERSTCQPSCQHQDGWCRVPRWRPTLRPQFLSPETGSVAAEAAVLRLEKLVSRMALRIKSSLRRRLGWKQRTWAALSLRAPSCCLRPRRKCLLLALQAEKMLPPVEVFTARHHLREILVQSQTLNLCVKVGAWMTSAPSLMFHPQK